jgi:hypothetical protein
MAADTDAASVDVAPPAALGVTEVVPDAESVACEVPVDVGVTIAETTAAFVDVAAP